MCNTTPALLQVEIYTASEAPAALKAATQVRQAQKASLSRSYAEDVTSVTSGASQGPHSFNSRSYAEDVTSVTSGASQGPHSFNSRSYAEDVTSVTSGASQGPHSFNLVFVCVFVCVTPGAIRI